MQLLSDLSKNDWYYLIDADVISLSLASIVKKIQKIDKNRCTVVHIGGKNINFRGINDINVKRIAEDIINIGKKYADFGSEIFI